MIYCYEKSGLNRIKINFKKKGFRKDLPDKERTALTIIFKIVFSIDFKQAFTQPQIQSLIVISFL